MRLIDPSNFQFKGDKKNNMRFAAIVLLSAVPVLLFADENLASKVIRIPLNQNEPALVKLGTSGITTLEFPYNIEALDGYGFSVNPAPDGPELFQISFNKGTNFLSLKATREGVEGNLTVVLDGKVYCLFCKAVPDPSFVVIFENGSGKEVSDPHEALAKSKQVSPARLLGFLDKVKAFPTLKVSAPEIFQNMDVTEPNSASSLDGLEVTLRRVIRDNSLDSLGFEVELVNKADKDFVYDPESFGVRVGEEVYPQTISDAGGLVPSGKTQTAFFVVTGTATGGRNDLAVTNKFDIVMRQVTGERDPHRKASAEWQEPPDAIPSAQSGWQEPALPIAESGSTPSQLRAVSDEKLRTSHKHRGKPSSAPGANRSTKFPERDRKDKTVAQDDE
jgi:hypothetical protein